MQWRVGFPFFQGYLHSASQHSTPGSIGAPNRPADDAAVTANAREPATQEARAGGSKSAMAREAMESQKKLRNVQESRAKADIPNSLKNAGYSKGNLKTQTKNLKPPPLIRACCQFDRRSTTEASRTCTTIVAPMCVGDGGARLARDVRPPAGRASPRPPPSHCTVFLLRAMSQILGQVNSALKFLKRHPWYFGFHSLGEGHWR